MLAGAAALLVVAAAVAFLPGRLAHLDPTRLVVGGFENRTGDSTLAPIGDIAADYIARGLATTQLLQEVYDARAMAREAGQPARVGVAAAAIWPAGSGPERCSAGTTTARATGCTSRPRWWMPGPDGSSSRCSR